VNVRERPDIAAGIAIEVRSVAIPRSELFSFPDMPVISSTKPYRIGRSKTGLGLFATRPIKKGTKIIRYTGPMLDCRKEKDDAVENKYLFQINSRWTIDGSVRRNIARYINHSCRPNAESDVNTRKRTVHIRAIKDIAPGEEINYDYGTEYFKEYLKPIGCKCDSCERKRAKLRAEAVAGKTAARKTPAGKNRAKSRTSKTKAGTAKAADISRGRANAAKAKAGKSGRPAKGRGASVAAAKAGKARQEAKRSTSRSVTRRAA